MAEAGAAVVAVGRDKARLDNTTAEIRAAGRECVGVVADITSDDAPARIVGAAVQSFGGLDCLVHNAGIFHYGALSETSLSDLDLQYATHLRAPFALTREALPQLGPGSAVLVIGSNLAHHGMANTSAYSASKGGVEALVRALAVELGPRGIRVNSLSPGVTRTPMTTSITDSPSATAGVLAATPIGRLGETDDIAAAATFLCSDAASFIVGTSLVIDGGQSVR
jgi:NAD(P)-dependent dehydrogenase (short-subunit alcohol dehydrogenase family)